MVLPTAAQVSAVMTGANPGFQAFVAMAAFAGLRLGEAAGLQVAEINFLRRSLDVRRQVQRAGVGAVEVRAPKYGSERLVYLPDSQLEVLAGHIAQHRPSDDPTRWLFQTTTGPTPHRNTVGHLWRMACQRTGVTGLTLHDLRYCYASGLGRGPVQRGDCAASPQPDGQRRP